MNSSGHRLFICNFSCKPPVVFCRVCGCWTAERKVGIGKACQEPKKSGRATLSRINRGLHPQRGDRCYMIGRPEPFNDSGMGLAVKEPAQKKVEVIKHIDKLQAIYERVRARC